MTSPPSEPSQTAPDGWIRRILWPSGTLANRDALGRQGFVICFAVALWELVQWSAADAKTSVLTFLFYAVGAVGIREHSRAAAAIVFAWNVLGQLGDHLMGLHPSVISYVVTVLLVVALRTTFVAASLRKWAVWDLEPRRPSALIWRFSKWPYFVICGALVLLSAWGTVEAVYNPSSISPIEGDQRTSAPSR